MFLAMIFNKDRLISDVQWLLQQSVVHEIYLNHNIYCKRNKTKTKTKKEKKN